MTVFMIQVLALVAGFLTAVFAAGAEKPNIVLIIADDLGYGKLGFQGCTEIPTPHIDSIAKNGTRFTHGYATCSMCHLSLANSWSVDSGSVWHNVSTLHTATLVASNTENLRSILEEEMIQ